MSINVEQKPLSEADIAAWPWLCEHGVMLTLQPAGQGYLAKLPLQTRWQRAKTLAEIPDLLNPPASGSVHI